MKFTGEARKATPAEINAVALSLGVEPAVFRSVISVEAAGSGFDKAKRPKALFERHVFYRQLSDAPGLQANAVAENLAYPRWGTRPYPRTSDGVYKEIERACAIDEEAALFSTSWGLGQILGLNYRRAGCATVHDMVEGAKASEAQQLEQMASFIRNAGLADELQKKNWAGFAKGYNGPSYSKNAYDVKLAQAYSKLSGSA